MTKVCGIEISNPDKIVFKQVKKIDIVNYYEEISSYIMPFLQKRPITEIVCHDKFNDCFFRKHPQKSNDLICVNSKINLIEQVQLGTTEFHIYPNSTKDPDSPNIMTFDLDPDDSLPIDDLRQGVLHLKEILDKLNLKCFLKTSGGKGYHVVVPFSGKITWHNFEIFAQNVASLMGITYPERYTTNIRKNERKGKIFIDYLRNKKGATCVAPFSLRARDNLPISFPIEWDDLYKIKPNQINISNYKRYLKKDVWQDFFKTSQRLK